MADPLGHQLPTDVVVADDEDADVESSTPPWVGFWREGHAEREGGSGEGRR